MRPYPSYLYSSAFDFEESGSEPLFYRDVVDFHALAERLQSSIQSLPVVKIAKELRQYFYDTTLSDECLSSAYFGEASAKESFDDQLMETFLAEFTSRQATRLEAKVAIARSVELVHS